jgi:hypothetical protein
MRTKNTLKYCDIVRLSLYMKEVMMKRWLKAIKIGKV